MAPEHDARTRAFYDHESDEPAPARRRRAAADWGLNEDIFDRMPSRRFKRGDRRAEHHDDPAARFERRTSGPAAAPRAAEWADDEPRYDDWGDAHERRQVAPRRGDWADAPEPRRAAEWDEDEPRREDQARATEWGEAPAPRRHATEWADDAPPARRAQLDGAPAPRRAGEWPDDAPAARRAQSDGAPAPRRAGKWADGAPATRRAPGDGGPRRAADDGPRRAAADAPRRATAGERRPARRPAESWTAGDEGNVEIEGKRPIQSWLEPERGESRTIVLERAEPETVEPIEDPPGRRTVTITGHPDRLPAPRAQRRPRTAVERIGASPDRIAGYAVLLGFMLILIAVLTTGQ